MDRQDVRPEARDLHFWLSAIFVTCCSSRSTSWDSPVCRAAFPTTRLQFTELEHGVLDRRFRLRLAQLLFP